MLRARYKALWWEIQREPEKVGAEQYADLVQAPADPDDRAQADLLVDINLVEIDRDVELRDIHAALERVRRHAEPVGAPVSGHDGGPRRPRRARPEGCDVPMSGAAAGASREAAGPEFRVPRVRAPQEHSCNAYAVAEPANRCPAASTVRLGVRGRRSTPVPNSET